MHTINIFGGILFLLILLGVLVPYVNEVFDETSVNNVDDDKYDTFGEITLNLALIPFWTFGLNEWINLLILLPIRIIGGVCVYYILFPTKS